MKSRSYIRILCMVGALFAAYSILRLWFTGVHPGLSLLMPLLLIVTMGIPALAAYGFQLAVCLFTRNKIMRLLPLLICLLTIIFECVHPLYAMVILHAPCFFCGIPEYFIIPLLLFANFTAWTQAAESQPADK